MAFYDFVCRECGHEFEIFSTGFLKDEQKVCPVCSSTQIDQQFSSFLSTGGSGGCAAPISSGFG